MSTPHDNVNILIKDIYQKLHAITRETLCLTEGTKLKFKTDYTDKRVARIYLKQIKELEKIKDVL